MDGSNCTAFSQSCTTWLQFSSFRQHKARLVYSVGMEEVVFCGQIQCVLIVATTIHAIVSQASTQCSKYPCTSITFQWANLYPGQALKFQVMFKHLWALIGDTTVHIAGVGGGFPQSTRDRRKRWKGEREVVEKGHMYFLHYGAWSVIHVHVPQWYPKLGGWGTRCIWNCHAHPHFFLDEYIA